MLWFINNLTKSVGNFNDSFLALTLFTIQHEIMHVNKITKSSVPYRGEKFLYTMANFFAPLQLICRSFVFIVFLLEFFCNIFVILKQNIYRQILLFAFKNFVSNYKIIAKVNFLINPFAKKLQVL